MADGVVEDSGGFLAKWPLNRVLVLALMLGFGGLLVDIRGEHVEVVREDWKAWIPLVYGGVMMLLCGITLVAWGGVSRRILFWAFVPALLVGGMGFYFHNERHLAENLSDSIKAWYDPEQKLPVGPPHFAPLAFAGIGVLGLLATAKQFQPRR